MTELIAQIIAYARGIWRYRWFIFLLAWPLSLAGWIYVSKMPDEYKAEARVYVDTQTLLRPLLRGLAVQMDLRGQIQMMTKTLLSRPNMEKVARMADLDLNTKTDEEFNELISNLMGDIELSGGRRDNLYTISYSHPEPQKAKQVVQAVLTVFVENTLGDKRRDSDSAQRFLEQQIKEYEARLFEAEERLKEFKRKNVGLMPSDGSNYYARLQEVAAELNNVELLKREAERRRDELQRQLVEATDDLEEEFLVVPPEPAMNAPKQAVDARIQALQAKLDELLLNYTENHPDVIAIRRTIKELENRKQVTQQATVESDIVPGVSQNPVVQQLKLALGEAEANVAALDVRVQEYKARYAKIQKLVDTIPAVEAELKRLNRDYEVTKKNYEQLLQRRESAKLAEEAEQSAENVKFRVVDPPFVDSEPSAPNRPLLLSAVFGLSLAVGVGLAFLLSQINPVVDSVQTLRRVAQLPVLGSVSRILTRQQIIKRRIEVALFASVGLLYLGFYATTMLMNARGINWFV